MKIWKISGIYLIIVGCIHNMVTLGKFKFILEDIVQDGIFFAIGADYERRFIVFYLLSGFLMIFLGLVFQWLIHVRQQPLPMWMGWVLLLHILPLLLLLKVPGPWLALPLPFLIIVADWKYTHDKKGLTSTS